MESTSFFSRGSNEFAVNCVEFGQTSEKMKLSEGETCYATYHGEFHCL